MSAPQNTGFQVNFKTPTPAGTLINVYAETVVEGIAKMQEMVGAIPVIFEIEQALASGTLTVPPVVNNVSAPAPAAPAAPQTAPASTGNTCKHGPMTYREGQGKRGPWRAYMCPAPKGAPDQCEPVFLR